RSGIKLSGIRVSMSRLSSTLPLLIPAHSASKTRVNALMLGIQPSTLLLGPRNGVPATRASRGAPRGDERRRHSASPKHALPVQPQRLALGDLDRALGLLAARADVCEHVEHDDG